MMRSRLGSTLSAAACAAILTVPPAPGGAQSFDCDKAGNPTERAICSYPGLGDFDDGIAAAYKAARDQLSGTDRETLSAEQRAWIGQRNSCGDDYSCITDSYFTRLEQLSARYSLFPGWAGDYYSNASGVDITVVAGTGGAYAVSFMGGGENYTCGPVEGVGRSDGQSMSVIANGVEIMNISAMGRGIFLPTSKANEALGPQNCGERAPGFGGMFFSRE